MINLKETINSVLIKKMFKSFTVYTSATFINQLIPFLLLPVLTRFLSPRDYGIIATFIAAMGILNVVVSMGSPGAVMRGYFDREKKDFNFPQYTFNAACIMVFTFLIVIMMLLFTKSFISQKLAIPVNWLLLLPVIGICASIYTVPLKLFVFKQNPLPYITLQISNTFTEIVLAIFFVVIIGLDWRGRILSITITKILFFGIGLFLLFNGRLLDFSINYRYIKDILRFGMPVILHSLGLVAVIAIDRFFLNTFSGFSTTGLYSVAYSVTLVISLFISSFALAWNPILYEKLGKPTEDLKIKLVKFTYICFIAIFLGVLLFIIIAPLFLKILVGKEFYGANRFIPWLALGFAFNGMYIVVAQYIFYKKKTYLAAIIGIITILLCIVFDYTLIKLHGPIGIAQAACLVFISRFLLFWYFGNKVYPMPWFSFMKRT